MTYFLPINTQKMIEFGLNFNQAAVMCVFADLESWADKHRSIDLNDHDFYYTLYLSKLQHELPMLGSVSTISRAVTKLESLGLIKSINKNTTPAYALTAKGLSWKKITPPEKPNDGETDPSQTTPPKETKEPAPKKEPKRHAFSLPKKCLIDECPDEYMKRLQEAAYLKCDRDGISREEYGSFVRYYMKSDIKWRNWLAVFGDWCKRHREKEKPNKGEFRLPEDDR